MIKNKRGDLPVTILVIGVLGICVFALVSFNFANIQSAEDFSESIDMINNFRVIEEKTHFFNNMNLDPVVEQNVYSIGERKILDRGIRFIGGEKKFVFSGDVIGRKYTVLGNYTEGSKEILVVKYVFYD